MSSSGRLAIAAAIVSASAACKFPYPEDVPDVRDGRIDAGGDTGIDAPATTHAVGGSVTGLWMGGAVTVHLDAGAVHEDLAVDATLPFAFAARLDAGVSYLVSVVDDGPDHDCVVNNGSGRIEQADISDVAVECTNLIPHNLAISTAVAFTFDPRVTRYVLPVSVLQQETTVVVSGATLTGATVAGQPVTLGQSSAPVLLGAGQTSVVVNVTKGALSQRYELVFDRGAAPIVEALYGRASNAETDDTFGRAVAASGDLVAIGAPGEDGASPEGNDNNSLASGAVYAFRRSGPTWTQIQLFRGSTVTAFRNFGTALAMDGDVLVVGVPRESQARGSVYVFRFTAATNRWTEQQKIVASDPHADDNFGNGVAVSGDRIAIGAYGHDGGVASSDYGLVYLYRWDGTRWSEEARVRPPSPQQGDQFGAGVELDHDNLVATRSAFHDVYRRSGATWTREAQLPSGYLDLSGDEVAIGQYADASGNGQPNDTSAPNSGAVRVYARSGTTWSEVAYLKASPPQTGARLGSGVALRNNVIVTAASGTRMLHTFQRVGGSWVALPPIAPSGNSQALDFGIGIALTGVGAVTTADDDNGPAGATPNSGTAWFFR